MKKITTLILSLGISGAVFSQSTQLLRQPSLSENEIVFVYANDL